MESKFVNYLNTLHSYSGHNANVFAEKNVDNEFYKKMMVEVSLCDFIINELTNKDPHIIMLTGHAGDGKTSLMFQVLNKMGCNFDSKKDKFDVLTPNGKKVLCIKDFSEFPDDQKLELMKISKEYQDNGMYVLMVANTGPLINAFTAMFSEEKKTDAESKFIDALDVNSGKTVEIGGYKVCLINIVNVDNTYFASKFLDNVVESDEWDKCKNCEKANYCHILRNIKLMKENKSNTFSFINKHYIWQNEYGNRLTIRSMTQQLAFMITGGMDCKNIKEFEPYKYLYSNLFFGYVGTKVDEQAHKILAIRDAYNYGYDQKRLRADETLFVREDYKSIFSKYIEDIILDMFKKNGNINGTNQLLRRMYFFYNTKGDSEIDDEDIFSKQFRKYIRLKNGNEPDKNDNLLVKSALNMIYTGAANSNGSDIPVTLNRESGYTQNVQYVIGTIKQGKVKIKIVKSVQFENYTQNQWIPKIMVEGNELNQVVNLPLLDYFEDLKNGVISTNIDAQLSKGIENIKSEILNIVLKDIEDDGDFSLIVLGTGTYDTVNFSISDERIS